MHSNFIFETKEIIAFHQTIPRIQMIFVAFVFSPQVMGKQLLQMPNQIKEVCIELVQNLAGN